MDTWSLYEKYLCAPEGLGVSVDPSRMGLDDAFLEARRDVLARAYQAMRALEGGAIANPDEGRMVGHYWLRDPSLAPGRFREEIQGTIDAVVAFADEVLKGRPHRKSPEVR